jgi:hypothetical protein
MSAAPELDDEDDTSADEVTAHLEEILSRHEPACILMATEDAYDHGIDVASMAREVAAQFLEDGTSACICQPPLVEPAEA